MRTLWLKIVFFFSFTFFLFGQSSSQKLDDFGKIILSAYLPENLEITTGARRVLMNKLYRIVSVNGMGNGSSSKFVLTSNVNEISKEITPTAPPMIAYNLEVSLYVGDGENGTLFSSTSLMLKGVGTNETKAYNSALKRINPSSELIQNFVNKGKSKIIQYYNSKCDFIIKEAESLLSRNEFDRAIFELANIPKISEICYDRSIKKITEAYSMKINYECKKKVNSARVAISNRKWDEASSYLFGITSGMSCYNEALSLMKTIEVKIEQEKKIETDLKKKRLEADINLEKKRLEADINLEKKRLEADINPEKKRLEADINLEKKRLEADINPEKKRLETDINLEKKRLEAALQVALKYAENQPEKIYITGWQ